MAIVPMFYHLTTIALLLTAAASQSPPTKYINHTVGDNAGWFFNSTANTTSANYSSWAASQTFNLGDFLMGTNLRDEISYVDEIGAVFNTNSNQTVVQTYNITTYQSCSVDDSSDNDTFLYNSNTTAFSVPFTVSVPLTIEGSNFFFSDAEDGIQCLRGMAFQIEVNRGLGLPPSLNQPPPPPYIEPPGRDSAQSPPVTVSVGSSAQGLGRASFRVGACALLFFVCILLTH